MGERGGASGNDVLVDLPYACFSLTGREQGVVVDVQDEVVMEFEVTVPLGLVLEVDPIVMVGELVVGDLQIVPPEGGEASVGSLLYHSEQALMDDTSLQRYTSRDLDFFIDLLSTDVI